MSWAVASARARLRESKSAVKGVVLDEHVTATKLRVG
jgi:hypothetical protein